MTALFFNHARVRRSLAPILAALVLAGATASGPEPVEAAARPSIVVINTDDQRWDTLWAMPNVQSLLADHGVTFTNAFVSNTLCCPSRAGLLTGQYSHSNGIWRNEPPYGGFASFDPSSTVATWLQGSGYRTALVGKYLNRYQSRGRPEGYIPPGWDHWVAFLKIGFFDYDMLVDGTIEAYGSEGAEYSTDVLAAKASSFIRDTNGPLFLYFAPYAPHAPATPAPRHAGMFAGLPKWRPPSYNERDASDKPFYIQDRYLEWWTRRKQDQFRIDQLESLRAVDDAVAELVAALSDTGRLQNTMIVFTSDNGLAWGEHRWTKKRVPYEESIRVPFVVRYDPLISQARTDPRFVMNIDIAPTAADLAGVEAPGVDGRSLLPMLADPGSGWRRAVLVERLSDRTKPWAPSYCAIRNQRFLYVYYGTGERELYDLRWDVHQLRNLALEPGNERRKARLHAKLRAKCSPPPPDMIVP